jgi:hypothetical protein
MQQDTMSNDEVFVTSSTRLATALLCLGHSLRRPPCTRQIRRDGQQIVTFLFEPSTEGAIETCGKIAGQWSVIEAKDPGSGSEQALRDRLVWLREMSDPKDPVAFAYANAAWRDIALSIVKATPRMVQIEAAGAIAFIREDATPQDHRNLSKYL